MKKEISTDNVPQANGLPYSQAIEVNGFIYLSGQIHLDKDGNLMEGDIKSLTKIVMDNLQNVLKASSCTFDNVVKTEIFLTDLANFSDVNEVYSGYLKKPYPARTTVGVKELPKGAKVEISMIAYKGN